MDQRELNVLLWNVHGGYTNALSHLPHRLLLPTTPDRGPFGRGRVATWNWSPNAREVDVDDMRDTPIDIAIVQRPEELHLLHRWSGRKPGVEYPVIYLEHNTPAECVPLTRHPLADRDDMVIVHITHFNQVMWDCGGTRTHVIEHGLPDPGVRWEPHNSHAAVVVNDPISRGRTVGTDLLPLFARVTALDAFGRNVHALPAHLGITDGSIQTFEGLGQRALHEHLRHRAVYLHPHRWTSLSLSLIEAMFIGMPVVAFASTEVSRALPPTAGCTSTDVRELQNMLRTLTHDRDMARRAGQAAREAALGRFGLHRFTSQWDTLLRDLVGNTPSHKAIRLRDPIALPR
jgi:hypothetical protein